MVNASHLVGRWLLVGAMVMVCVGCGGFTARELSGAEVPAISETFEDLPGLFFVTAPDPGIGELLEVSEGDDLEIIWDVGSGADVMATYTWSDSDGSTLHWSAQ